MCIVKTSYIGTSNQTIFWWDLERRAVWCILLTLDLPKNTEIHGLISTYLIEKTKIWLEQPDMPVSILTWELVCYFIVGWVHGSTWNLVDFFLKLGNLSEVWQAKIKLLTILFHACQNNNAIKWCNCWLHYFSCCRLQFTCNMVLLLQYLIKVHFNKLYNQPFLKIIMASD